ncbi:MAG: hypothetical protein IPL78_16360 [Chloroflexi bacterium]|nr:hypothetical protein [Chloroflexota bacterium]
MNPLVQRVRRHANMGVLFRSRNPGAEARGSNAAATPATDNLTGLPLVRATLFPLPSWVNRNMAAAPAIQTMSSGEDWTSAPLPQPRLSAPAWGSPAMSSPAPAEPRLSEGAGSRAAGSLPLLRSAAAPAPAPMSATPTTPVMRQATSMASAPAMPAPPIRTTASLADPVPVMRTTAPTTPIALAAASTQTLSPDTTQSSAPLPVTASPSQPPAPSPVVMRATESAAAAPSVPTSAPTSSTPPGQAFPVAAPAGPESTLTTEWSRLETIMRLHKERAAEQGAEGGIIPAPPQPETTHLQTMMEKQKRLYSPSRMPPPELRRRAEVLTLSPDEMKGKGDISPTTVSGESPVQRVALGSAATSPPDVTPKPEINAAPTSALPTAAAPESPTAQPFYTRRGRAPHFATRGCTHVCGY